MSGNKQYLGESVYAQFDGYGFVLTTENGYDDDPRNRIVLDPSVFASFVKFADAIIKRTEAPS